jgi:apolipoprotein N-acyltransferase
VPLKTRDTLYSHIGDTVEIMLLWFFAIYLVIALLSGIRRKQLV